MSTFEGELRALGKRRIALPELRAAYLRAHPEALNAPDGRRLLLDALQALERDGVMELPRQGWDTSGSPELPRTASLRVSASPRRTPTPLCLAAGARLRCRRASSRAPGGPAGHQRLPGFRAREEPAPRADEGALAADLR